MVNNRLLSDTEHFLDECADRPVIRKKLIHACLMLMANTGLHKVSFETVAFEAGIDYASVKNVFEDDQSLILASFKEYLQSYRGELNKLWFELDVRQSTMPPFGSQCRQTRHRYRDELVVMCSREISRWTNVLTEELKIELILLSGIASDEKVKVLEVELYQQMYQPVLRLCRRLERKKPEEEACQLLNTILSISYSGLGKPHGPMAFVKLEQELKSHIGQLFDLSTPRCANALASKTAIDPHMLQTEVNAPVPYGSKDAGVCLH